MTTNMKFADNFNQLLDQDNNLTKLMILVRFPGIKFDIDTRIKYAIDVIEYYYKYNYNEICELNKLVMCIGKIIEKNKKNNNVEWTNTKKYIKEYEIECDNYEIQKINETYNENEEYDEGGYYNYEDEGLEESFY